MSGEAAVAVIDFACRVPFDAEVLSVLAHARGLRPQGFRDIEVGECEKTFNLKLKMLQFFNEAALPRARRQREEEPAPQASNLATVQEALSAIAGGRVLSQAGQASDDNVAWYVASSRPSPAVMEAAGPEPGGNVGGGSAKAARPANATPPDSR